MNMDTLDVDLTVFDTTMLSVAYSPLDSALGNWADATTVPTSDRRDDLKHAKQKAVGDFFQWIGKPVHEITPNDVKSWQNKLEKRNLAPATVYAMISRISSFFDWLMKAPDMAGWVVRKPVTLGRPKAPRAYQSESTKSLDDDQIRAMVQAIKSRTDVVGKRDYALLLFFLLSGLRRNEVAQLRWKDLNLNDSLLVTYPG